MWYILERIFEDFMRVKLNKRFEEKLKVVVGDE